MLIQTRLLQEANPNSEQCFGHALHKKQKYFYLPVFMAIKHISDYFKKLCGILKLTLNSFICRVHDTNFGHLCHFQTLSVP